MLEEDFNKNKHKNHDKYKNNKDVIKQQKLERIASDMIRAQDKNDKLKEKHLSIDIFKLFDNNEK